MAVMSSLTHCWYVIGSSCENSFDFGHWKIVSVWAKKQGVLQEHRPSKQLKCTWNEKGTIDQIYRENENKKGQLRYLGGNKFWEVCECSLVGVHKRCLMNQYKSISEVKTQRQLPGAQNGEVQSQFSWATMESFLSNRSSQLNSSWI